MRREAIALLLVLTLAPVACRDSGGAVLSTPTVAAEPTTSAPADALRDPAAPGPYAVGLTRMTFTRTGRDGAPRALDTWIWYPAQGASPGSDAVDDAPAADNGAPFPIVIFSHGSRGRPDAQKFFTEHLASWGYVIAAPPHPGNTTSDCVLCGADVILKSAMQRPLDVTFVLDQIIALKDDASSPLGKIVDPETTAIAGHSFGGWTSIFVAPNGRFDAAIAMAPGQPTLLIGQAHKTNIPTLIFAGGKDELVDPTQARELGDAFPEGTLLTYVFLPEGHHLTFIDHCLGCSAALPETRGHELTDGYATAFLQVYLRGDRRYAAYLKSPPPDALVDTR